MLRKLDSHKILRLIVENTPWNVLRPDPKVRDISAKIMVSIFICFSTYALKDQSSVVPPIPFPRLGSSMVLQEAWIFTRSILLFFDRTLIFL